jgi:hypothetical protein
VLLPTGSVLVPDISLIVIILAHQVPWSHSVPQYFTQSPLISQFLILNSIIT